MSFRFQVLLKEDFTLVPGTGFTQEQIDWLLSNLFWIGLSEEPGYIRVTFYIWTDQENEEENDV